MSDEMFPCKQITYTKKGKSEFDRIFGHGVYNEKAHDSVWNKALKYLAGKYKVIKGNR
jgi:hypothetical protein